MSRGKRSSNLTDAKRARKSAALVGAVLLALAAWQAYRCRPNLMYGFGGAGAFLVLIAMVSDRASILFDGAWMKLAALLGWVNSRILLSMIYFLLFTPMGWIRKAAGGDPLRRRSPKSQTYWAPREVTRPKPEQFERLF